MFKVGEGVRVFKVGDKVKCVETDPRKRAANRITLGRVYPVLSVDRRFVLIYDDNGYERSVFAERFVLADAPSSSVGLPTDSATRKNLPVTSSVLDYFPLAVAYVAYVSKVGNDQHNPGQPMHWAREKSTDHPDCIARHLMERGTKDTDGLRHSGKLAWRALANLQREIEDALAAGEQPFEVKP